VEVIDGFGYSSLTAVSELPNDRGSARRESGEVRSAVVVYRRSSSQVPSADRERCKVPDEFDMCGVLKNSWCRELMAHVLPPLGPTLEALGIHSSSPPSCLLLTTTQCFFFRCTHFACHVSSLALSDRRSPLIPLYHRFYPYAETSALPRPS